MFNVGEIEVRRIEESLGHGFQPNAATTSTPR